ncbi:LuxR C-terminal-related transcriptional regulator [Streptomyces sp. FH025]|uniref:LuxR C-terminal-related transcriptional regulator n=1 Tax=Streptomyces sp. FH025 TaxID=2815937 RepID=UPI001A9FDB29|nr:LuxR C-terminal-related transcriptional regulator [Streptomyces sp. FH025]MBO1413744.1 helix-turn-helix transcriptional regulator [Streptomyces sp. FH025]
MRTTADENQVRKTIDGLLESARTAGGALAVTGAPGSGVSTALREAADSARRRGFLVIETTALAADADSSGAMVRALRDRLLRSVRPSFTPAFAFLTSSAASAAELFRLLGGSPRPVLVTVDDARYLDGPSRRVLSALARELPAVPAVLLVGGQALDGAAELVLPPVDEVHAERLLRQAGVHDADLRRRIVQDAGGSPLALRELPLSWRDTGAPGEELLRRFPPLTERLSRSVAPGLAELPPDTGAVVLLAAVQLGDQVADVLVPAQELTGRPIGLDAFEPAVAHGLLRLVDGQIRFRSVLARAAVQHHATAPALLAAHTVLARTAADPYRASWHAAHGTIHQHEQVAGPLEASAAQAERLREPVQALRRLELSARLSPGPADRARRLIRAARTAFELGRPGLAEHLLDRAGRLGLDEEQQALADTMRTRFTARPERGGRTLSERCRLVSRLARSGRREAALEVLVGAVEAAAWADPDPRARQAVSTCLAELADADGDPRWLLAQAAIAPNAARERITDLIGSGPTTHPDAERLRLLGTAALTAGEPGRAGDLLAHAARLLRADGRIGLLAQVQAQHAQAALVVGDWDLAHAVNEETFAIAEAGGHQLWSIRARATRAVLLAFRGDPTASAAEIATVERIAAGRQVGAVLATLRLARSVALFDSDDPSSAYQTLRPLFEPGSPSHHRTIQRRALCYLAEAAVRAGQAEDARQVLAGFGDGRGLPLSTAVNFAQARALLAEGPDAERHFEHALRITPRQWPWPRARAELAYGMWLRRARRPSQARPLLREACHAFEVLGATAWREITSRELRATGVDQGRLDSRLTEQLSAQELTIAQLAAVGMTNREIGERLLLSPRTVGWHLHRVFPKLNVTSRTQLAALLATAA